MKKIIAVASILVVIIAMFIIFSVSNDRKRIRDSFSEYEDSCTNFAEFLLKDAQSINQENVSYAISYHDGKYKLVRIDNDTNSEVDLSVIEEDLSRTEQAFSKMTGRYSITDVSVSKNYIIFQEDSYGGKLIYSIQGGIDKENRKTYKEYQMFRKINENWYAVYINAI